MELGPRLKVCPRCWVATVRCFGAGDQDALFDSKARIVSLGSSSTFCDVVWTRLITGWTIQLVQICQEMLTRQLNLLSRYHTKSCFEWWLVWFLNMEVDKSGTDAVNAFEIHYSLYLIQNTIHTSSQIQYRSIRKFNLIWYQIWSWNRNVDFQRGLPERILSA